MSSTVASTIRVAVTQHSPVYYDLPKTVEKTISIVQEAAQTGARLVVFPELWIPGYPGHIWLRTGDFDMNVKYIQNCLRINSPEMRRIRDAAAENQINVALGFAEKDEGSGSIYIAQALIDDTGCIRMTRRKMKPTHQERTLFGDARSECLAKVVNIDPDHDIKVGSLNCFEHAQSLLKYYVYSQGENIHVAAWPFTEPFTEESHFIVSNEGIQALCQAYAIESQSFVLSCTAAITEAGIDTMRTNGAPVHGKPTPGDSAIFAPDGRRLTAKNEAEKFVIADLDMSLVTKAKLVADGVGHYGRPELMWLGVDTRHKACVRLESD